jgi:type I restriction enzyme S subunit
MKLPAYPRTKPSGVDSKFIAYMIEGNQPALLALWRQQGATVESLTFESVKTTNLHLPDLAEQRSIAAYLDEETAKLDALVGKVEEAVERLQEYRTALITAAVTGKIDVGKAVPAASSTAGIG